MIVQGLEHTFKSSSQGGVASALMVLEVAATHYYIRDNKSNSSSQTNSPFGSRESLSSLGKDSHSSSTRHSKRVSANSGDTPKGWYYISSLVLFMDRSCLTTMIDVYDDLLCRRSHVSE